MSTLAQAAYFMQLVAFAASVALILHVRRIARPGLIYIAFAAGCAALALLSFRISDPSYFSWDFHSAYYPAGRAVLTSARQLREMTGLGVSGFVNMPAIAYMFAPFGLLPEQAAKYLFLVIGLAAVIAAWQILARMAALDVTERCSLLLVFAANGPLLYSLKEGNTSHFILLALVGALAMVRSARTAAGGALLGAAAMIKPPLLLFLLFFILRRDIRGTIGFVTVCGGIALLSLAIFGWDDNWHWFEVCIVQFNHRWLAAFNVQSIPAFLFRLVMPAGLLQDWNSSLPPMGLKIAADIFFALLIAVAMVALWRRNQLSKSVLPTLELQYNLFVCLAILASPLSWSHYYCWLLLPAAFFLGWRQGLPRSSRICGWLAIMLVTPVVRLLHFSSPWMLQAYKDVAVSHLLFGGLLWFGLIVLWLARPLAPSRT